MYRACPPRPRIGAGRGFSVLELIVTLSVGAILLGIALPACRGVWLDSRRAIAVNAFVHSIFLARRAALAYRRTVSICRSLDGQTCSTDMANWQLGWIVFVNEDRDEPPMRDANERLLALQEALPGGTITSNRHGYSFKPYSRSVVNGTLVFCDRRGSADARAIVINIAGRPRLAKRDADNRPLRCPSG